MIALYSALQQNSVRRAAGVVPERRAGLTGLGAIRPATLIEAAFWIGVIAVFLFR